MKVIFSELQNYIKYPLSKSRIYIGQKASFTWKQPELLGFCSDYKKEGRLIRSLFFLLFPIIIILFSMFLGGFLLEGFLLLLFVLGLPSWVFSFINLLSYLQTSGSEVKIEFDRVGKSFNCLEYTFGKKIKSIEGGINYPIDVRIDYKRTYFDGFLLQFIVKINSSDGNYLDVYKTTRRIFAQRVRRIIEVYLKEIDTNLSDLEKIT
ncbi:MAG: hypothetical protein ACTSUE_24060 [Promethearchaeota archaeon]